MLLIEHVRLTSAKETFSGTVPGFDKLMLVECFPLKANNKSPAPTFD